MKSIFLIIKGFFMGLANLIPGVSGGTIAITLGIYDKLISCISHFFTNIKENIKFIIPIVIGIALSILTLSKVISFCLDKYLFPTIMFFIGSIIGGIPMLYKKISKHKTNIIDLLILILSIVFVISVTFIVGDNIVSLQSLSLFGYIKLLLVGVIASATMVIPGISGSAVLMTLGYYEPIINILKDLTNFSNLGYNLSILIPFGIGVLMGIILIAKLIEYLFKKYEVKTYYAIIGFVISSVISIIMQNFIMNGLVKLNLIETIIGVILFVVGYLIAYKLGDK